MNKRTIGVALAIIILVAMLSGCGSNSGGKPIAATHFEVVAAYTENAANAGKLYDGKTISLPNCMVGNIRPASAIDSAYVTMTISDENGQSAYFIAYFTNNSDVAKLTSGDVINLTGTPKYRAYAEFAYENCKLVK